MGGTSEDVSDTEHQQRAALHLHTAWGKKTTVVFLRGQLDVLSSLFSCLQSVIIVIFFRKFNKYYTYISGFTSGVRHEEIQRAMESTLCVLSDNEDFQTLVSNTANNLHFER